MTGEEGAGTRAAAAGTRAAAAGATATEAVRRWTAAGHERHLLGHTVFVVDLPATGGETHEPLLVVHGFPTSSFDFHLVAPNLRAGRRVVLFDMLGYGLSDKPDRPYSIDLQADLAAELTAQLGFGELALLTHDVGDTVGGELLARQLEGRWPVTVGHRVVTNGSIYIESAHLTDGQQFLLALPDERMPADAPLDAATLSASLRATFSPASEVDESELEAAWMLMSRHDGQLLLARLIRYIEERRRHQARYTGAIERHPSPLAVVWGADDPIAVAPMSDRLHAAVPGSSLTVLDQVGHYPMIEAPDRFAAAVTAGLAHDAVGP